MTTTIKSAVVGLSGGVDSGVCAALLQECGISVEGVVLKVPGAGDKAVEGAKVVADILGIKLTVADISKDFERYVTNPFKESYKMGQTPNPCILCNPHVKFQTLLSYADKIGFDGVATGHYAGIEGGKLIKGADSSRDQSYMLHRLKRESLNRILFPLFGMSKDEVKARAAALGLPVPKDSQDLCFLPTGGYEEFVGKAKAGQFEDHNGKVLGTHDGIHAFTVGQKCGMFGQRLYVSNINGETGNITLVPDEMLYKSEIYIRDVNLLCDKVEGQCEVKIRHTPKIATANVELLGNGRAKITFKEPQRAPAPGQSAVMYSGDIVMGGGFIE